MLSWKPRLLLSMPKHAVWPFTATLSISSISRADLAFGNFLITKSAGYQVPDATSCLIPRRLPCLLPVARTIQGKRHITDLAFGQGLTSFKVTLCD
jgi:hypothetical protein